MNSILDVVSFMARHLDRDDFAGAVKCMMLYLYIPADMKGYYCVLLAISMLVPDPGQSLTKEVYPEVGHQMPEQINGKLVEKQIRVTINEAWKRREPEKWEIFFPDGKPTNGKLLRRLAEVVDLWQRCVREEEEAEMV